MPGTAPEPVNDGAPTIIDTHVHFWDLGHPTLRWDWVNTSDDHYVLGNIDAVRSRAYTMAALEAEARFASVGGFVHVQAAIGSPDPVDETRWLNQMADLHPALKAIVGHVDLGADDAANVIDQHLEASARFKGVRDFAVERWLASGVSHAGMERGLKALGSHGLVLDLDCEYPNMDAALAMAGRHPNLTIVLEHIGFPRRRDPDYQAAWAKGVQRLATAPNVLCKISGVAMTDPRFTMDSLKPWVQTVVEAFGPSRCMLGSNWPLDRLFASYDAMIAIYRRLLGDLSPAERSAVESSTAQATYRLALQPPLVGTEYQGH